MDQSHKSSSLHSPRLFWDALIKTEALVNAGITFSPRSRPYLTSIFCFNPFKAYVCVFSYCHVFISRLYFHVKLLEYLADLFLCLFNSKEIQSFKVSNCRNKHNGFFTVNKACIFPQACNLTLVGHRFILFSTEFN